MLKQQAGVKSLYYASTVCNGLTFCITFLPCVINNKQVVMSKRCFFTKGQ